MYVDVKRLVTVAAGVLIDPLPLALSLPFSWPDGRPASRNDIVKEWARVKSANDPEQQARFARVGARATKLDGQIRLAPADLDRVVDARLDANVAALTRLFPDFPTYPADCQLGLVSMAWAMGAGKIAKEFPKFSAYIRQRAFEAASAECDIDTTNNEGIWPRNAANRALFVLADLAEREGLDPSELLFRG